MSTLSELQREMAAALRSPGSLVGSAEWANFAEQHVAPGARLSPAEQLEIYREQFWLRHTSSLVEDFPGLGGILGQKDWERLAEAYLCRVAPDSYTLRDLGFRLPELIAEATWLPHRALCADMARLELAYVEIFDAPDTAPVLPQRLAGIPEESFTEARFILAPCVRLLSLTYPVAELRRRLREENEEAVAIPEPRPTQLVVYRHDLRLWDTPLSNVAFAFLEGLSQGKTLGAAAELAARSQGDEAEAEAELAAGLGGWLQEWTAKGFVTDVVI